MSVAHAELPLGAGIMFEESPTKRVRRSEAFTSFSSPSPSPSSHAYTGPSSSSSNSRLNFKCDIIPPNAASSYHEIHIQGDEDHHHHAPPTLSNEPHDQIFSFRLFAPKPNSAPAAAAAASASASSSQNRGAIGIARVNIRSPTPLSANGGGGGGGGFLVPFRPRSYYFTAPSSAEGEESDRGRKKWEYASTAIAGEEVRRMARCIAWPGTSLPWRVIRLSPSSLTKSAKNMPPSPTDATERSSRRAVRAGKKRRIAVRKKHAAEARATETDREKRSRRNREKKLKRREKNRRMKAEDPRETGEGFTGGGDDG